MTIGKSEALVADISMGAQTSPNAVFALAHQILVGLGVRRVAARASPKLPSPCKRYAFAYSGSGNFANTGTLGDIFFPAISTAARRPGGQHGTKVEFIIEVDE